MFDPQRHYQTARLEYVAAALEAWADNARLMLQRALPADEAPYRNQRTNYTALAVEIRAVVAEMKENER